MYIIVQIIMLYTLMPVIIRSWNSTKICQVIKEKQIKMFFFLYLKIAANVISVISSSLWTCFCLFTI